MRVRPADVPAADRSLVALRNRYEALFTRLIGDLPLGRGTDRSALRLMLIGALNWSQVWYRPGARLSPRAIARKFIGLLRQGQEVAT